MYHIGANGGVKMVGISAWSILGSLNEDRSLELCVGYSLPTLYGASATLQGRGFWSVSMSLNAITRRVKGNPVLSVEACHFISHSYYQCSKRLGGLCVVNFNDRQRIPRDACAIPQKTMLLAGGTGHIEPGERLALIRLNSSRGQSS